MIEHPGDHHAEATADDAVITDPIVARITELSTNVEPISGAGLVHRIRATVEVRRRRRRRRVRTAVALSVAAVLVAVLATVTFRDSDRRVQVTMSTDVVAAPRGTVEVSPSDGIADGQRVKVTAYGFDQGTTIRFFECVSATDLATILTFDREGPEPLWVCRNGEPDAPIVAVVRGSGTDVGGQGSNAASTRATATLGIEGFSPQVSRLIEESGATPYFMATTGDDDIPVMCSSWTERRTPPCRIVAIGTVDGKDRISASRPLSLDPDATAEPPATTERRSG